MKKIRNFLSAFAVVLAVAGAYVSNAKPFVTGFIYVATPFAHCQASGTDCPGGTKVCTDANSNTIYDTGVLSGTTCGTVLMKP